MKLLKSLIGVDGGLVGFIVEAKEREINKESNSTNKVIQPLPLQTIIQLRPRSSQFSVNNGAMLCKQNFKINSLPMAVIDNNNNITDISNEITLVSRILVDGKIKGFRVKLPNGNQTPFKYQEVISLTNWYKPTNFTVRNKDGKLYIAGLKGQSLTNLPEEEMTNDKTTGKKARTSSKAVDKKEVEGRPVIKNTDILSLFDLVRGCNGVIIKLKEDKYTHTTELSQKTDSAFHYLNNGEVGSAKLDFGETKLNATVNFKKPGYVQLSSMPTVLYSFTWSKKSIFVNGANNMSKFGIGVTSEVADTIKQVYGEELIAKKLDDIDVLKTLTLRNDLEYFEISADKLELMTPEHAQTFINSNINAEIINTAKGIYNCKMQQKIGKQFKENLEAILGEQTVLQIHKANSKLFGLYNGLDGDTLKELKELGINVFTGAFDKKQEMTTEEKENVNKAPTIIQEDNIRTLEISITAPTVKLAEIENTINGTKPIKKVTEEIIKIYNYLQSLTYEQNEASYQKLLSHLENIQSTLEGLKKHMWCYKMALLVSGGGVLNISDNWTEKPSKAKTRSFTNNIDNSVVMKVGNINVK